MKIIPCSITIGRPSSSHGDSYINVRIRDELSGIEFVDAKFPLADFMEALTGFAYRKGQAEIRGLEYVGMRYEREGATLRVSEEDLKAEGLSYYSADRERIQEFLVKKFPREGWILDTYLGSQRSVIRDHKSDDIIFNMSYFRYVPIEEGEAN